MAASPLDPPLKTAHPNALIDLEIPGSTGPLPIPPASAGETLLGINHGAAMDNFPEQGLQLYLPFWSQMSEGDSVKVLLDDAIVSTEVIDATEVGQRVTTFISAARLEPGPHTVKYVVSRVGQAAETSSETRIWVKLTRPGGQDQDGDTPGHSALKLTVPQDVINNGVDEDTAEAGVPITIEPYPDMAEGDDIKLSWGGEFVHHTVTNTEVGQAIKITVGKGVILAGGDSNANGLAVTYEVYDVVDNRSEDWAAEIRIVVDTGNSRLGSPFVKEAVIDVLDLDALAGRPVTVQIVAATSREMAEQLNQSLTPEQAAQLQASMGKETLSRLGALKADFVVGDKIAVLLTGTTAEDEPLSYEAPQITIGNLPHIFDVEIPNAVVRRLAKTQAVFSYRLIHADNTESKSKGAFIHVIGEAVRMAAPVAVDAQQGALDPELPQTTVQIPWDDSMAAGDQITLKWIGTRPDQTIYDPVLAPHVISTGEAGSKPPLFMTIAGSHLKAIEGGTLQLYFFLEKEVNGAIDKRESARASVLNVGEARPELPAPAVSDVIDGAMNPALARATLTVPNYTGKEIGDEVHSRWEGSQSGAITDAVTVNSFSKPNPIDFIIRSTDIAPNDGGTVTASYWVTRVADGHRSDSELVTFSVGKPVVLDPPTITGIKDSNGQDIPEGGSTADTRVTLSGTAPATQKVKLFDNTLSKGQVTANARGAWTREVTGLAVGSHALKAKALYGDGAESAARGFTVAAVVTPAISSIKTASGAEIPADGITVETSVTLTGAANAGLEVEVLDGSASKGKATANANGQWTLAISGLAIAAHAIRAKAVYVGGGESAVRRFSVFKAFPTIISIRDSNGVEIPEGLLTRDPKLTMSGVSFVNQTATVVALVNGIEKELATFPVGANGEWTVTRTFSTSGTYFVEIRGWGNHSALRGFTLSM
jgi:hypothetical protein